jgi:hypothetical protein
MSSAIELRAAAARLTLERDREELRQSLRSGEGRRSGAAGFPRSATFRWILGHLTPRALASTALTAAMMRPGLLQFIGRWALTRRRPRGAARAND